MTFLGELKRRNVVRVGIAYSVIGWVLAQIAEFAFENFGAPEWVLKSFVVLLLLGLPIVLIFAWAFEITPDGVKLEKDVDRNESITPQTGRKIDYLIIGVLVIAVAILSFDKLGNGDTTSVAGSSEQSIAVLPFVNMSDDADYFADGLTEELLNLLAKNRDLKVAGRTSSFEFKGKNDDLREIGDALGVSKVLEGSVRRSGERLRVTAQLINVDDGFHIWSETYDRELADVFDIQDEVAASITRALKLHLAPEAKRLTENTEAYSNYLAALALSKDDEFDTLPRGIALLEQAVALDPYFAKAYELKAQYHWLNAGYTVSTAVGQRQVFDAASRALALDPTLAGARSLKKTSDINNWSWIIEMEALEELVAAERTVLTLDTYAYDLATLGYFAEAEAVHREILTIDPLSSYAMYRVGTTLAMQDKLDEAITLWKQAADAGSESAHGALAISNLLANDDENAARHMAMFLFNAAWLGYPDEISFIKAARDPVSGKAVLDELVATKEASARIMAEARLAYDMYLAFGYLDEYMDIVDKFNPPGAQWAEGEDMESFGMTFREIGFTSHPAYIERQKRNGVTEVWDRRGAPDHCSKNTGEWVCE